MSFIHCYYFAQSYSAEPPSQWQSSDIQRFEKILKLETSFRGVQLQRNSKEQFLTALKEKSELLRFLDGFPEFAQLFRSKTNLLKEYPDCDYEEFNQVQLAFEVDRYLSEDWMHFIIEKIEQNQLFYLTFMMRYEALIPERVLLTLKIKIESILQQYHQAIQAEGNQSDWFLFQSYVKFTLLLKDQKLLQLIVEIESIREQKLKEIMEIIDDRNRKLSINEVLGILVVLFILFFLIISRVP
ncbi:hypothetical protein [Flavobacterium stagni]|uniref:Uncharacterized protein n=1 Tax=Flavobacterium stagni TaxID=2506421 RepID=A0A4Q1K6S5_9FLAO|nr:hypothetical protein [Flavobacterium stagni]RXR21672.1 hypothetical protein EQG61_11720 [Flavobacterium stagni]